MLMFRVYLSFFKSRKTLWLSITCVFVIKRYYIKKTINFSCFDKHSMKLFKIKDTFTLHLRKINKRNFINQDVAIHFRKGNHFFFIIYRVTIFLIYCKITVLQFYPKYSYTFLNYTLLNYT